MTVDGLRVHYLRADASAGAPPHAPTHLLLHPLAATATFMIDLIGPLTTYGSVVAPDLQGTLFGETETPHARAARMESNAQFVRAFTSTLGLDRVVVHGWSMGAGVAIGFAACSPDRVARAVLANPPLPARLTPLERVGWQILGRPAVLVGSALARSLVRLWGPRAIEAKLAHLEQDATPETFRSLGGDPSRIATETMALWIEQIARLRAHPERMGYAATAFASVVSAMYINRRTTWQVIDRITAPVLVFWGELDPLITRPIIDQTLTHRPDWDLHVVGGAGHAAPVEAPDEYAAVVGHWLARPQTTA